MCPASSILCQPTLRCRRCVWLTEADTRYHQRRVRLLGLPGLSRIMTRMHCRIVTPFFRWYTPPLAWYCQSPILYSNSKFRQLWRHVPRVRRAVSGPYTYGPSYILRHDTVHHFIGTPYTPASDNAVERIESLASMGLL
jgi:hypothetical protein